MSEKAEIKAGEIIARMDRIPIWGLSYIFIGILGIGFLFTFYDIFDINVSFIQTAVTIFHVSSPSSPQIPLLLGPAVLLNLIGYVIGSLVLSPVSDIIGRRRMLMITMIITGLGSLYNTFVNDYLNFVMARTITGIGVGADLAIVNTYIGEVAPTNGRAKYTSLVFLFSTLGATLGIWLGLLLTTPPAPFPLGLPFALGLSGFFAVNGWRVMYGIGALLALVGLLLRFSLPESPRWLISRNRISEAEKIVNMMEDKATKKLKQLPSLPKVITPYLSEMLSYADTLKTIFSNSQYVKRFVILFTMWLFGYMTVYTLAAGLTSVLASLGYPPPEAGIIAAMGSIGFILVPLTTFAVGDRLERKVWTAISVIFTFLGGLLIALAGTNVVVSFIGSIILFYGFNLWVPISYAWTAESFPTRARSTGFALCDGIGHVGGGIGLIIIASFISSLLSSGVTTGLAVEVFVIIGVFQLISTLIAISSGHKTANKRLDEISP
ncbi:MFS transporter [Sulfolobus acidocaldarius]|uniref:Sugar-related transporter n=4 Tax=Sulfolobus acidocaldarius TaxID=2285 RepID=Q4J7Z1_SULAC|nr:MFS transporter [Sulfolobus acidocaldarius]AAY81089.1 sugar-related transporter [Sulfolobus acidocaldarius DSM 639]AGE71695.1 sugar-related transporter [Sulfolobus acidocaldarius N8]AGE73968.1 sugar-related transporter [Sulfolobus acidocaldarius Ron12/I]ALU30098.1 MFS transporter [Sulfolobus acidocaldarius]ALU30788.1 MFS transporter [Sulfolobus acidocaldarius]